VTSIAHREKLKHRILRLVRSLPGEVIPAFLEVVTKETDPETITLVAENIAPLITREGAPKFIQFLDHPVLQLREVICGRLFDVADAPVLERLAKELQTRATSAALNDRLLAVRMAFLLPTEEATAILRIGLKDKSRWARIQAIRHVPVVDLEALKSDLQQLLAATQDERERWDIIASLAGITQ